MPVRVSDHQCRIIRVSQRQRLVEHGVLQRAPLVVAGFQVAGETLRVMQVLGGQQFQRPVSFAHASSRVNARSQNKAHIPGRYLLQVVPFFQGFQARQFRTGQFLQAKLHQGAVLTDERGHVRHRAQASQRTQVARFRQAQEVIHRPQQVVSHARPGQVVPRRVVILGQVRVNHQTLREVRAGRVVIRHDHVFPRRQQCPDFLQVRDAAIHRDQQVASLGVFGHAAQVNAVPLVQTVRNEPVNVRSRRP